MPFIQLHDVKRLSPKTAGFVVIPHSKLNPYRDNLVYLRVSLTNTMDFPSGLPRNEKHELCTFCRSDQGTSY